MRVINLTTKQFSSNSKYDIVNLTKKNHKELTKVLSVNTVEDIKTIPKKSSLLLRAVQNLRNSEKTDKSVILPDNLNLALYTYLVELLRLNGWKILVPFYLKDGRKKVFSTFITIT